MQRSLIEYYDLFRALAGLKGKKGYRKFEFDECSLFSDGKFLNMKLKEGFDDVFMSHKEGHQINLTYNYKITTVNIYKSFCKFALSIVPTKELTYFKKTINWLNGDVVLKELPSVLTSFSIGTNSNDSSPQIMLFLRKNDDLSFPYLVVELTFNSSKIIFIVPACKKDDRNFKSKTDKELFKKTFCTSNKEWKETEYDKYKVTNIPQGYALEMTPMEKPPEGA